MTRDQFRRDAVAIAAELLGQGAVVLVTPQETPTWLGWRGVNTGFVFVGGKQVRAKITVAVTIEGSAGWPEK